MNRLGPLLMASLLVSTSGCGTRVSGPAPSDLPPAYTSGQITDPKLEEVAQQFKTWAEGQQAVDERVFSRIEILPPVETLSPYGIGTFQKERRLPAILTTGPGWSQLKPAERELLASKAYQELAGRLAALESKPPLLPTVTLQTPQGLELAWINDLPQGRKLLHGDDD